MKHRFWLAVVPVLLLCAASITAPTYDYKTQADAGMKFWAPSGYQFWSKDASVIFDPGGPITCSSGSCVEGSAITSLPVAKVTGWNQCGTDKVLSSPDGGTPVCVTPPELDPLAYKRGTFPLCAPGEVVFNDDAGVRCVANGAWTDVAAFAPNDAGAPWATTPVGWGWAASGYRKSVDGRVQLRGGVSNGTDGYPAFTLPTGYRPTNKIYSAAACGVSSTVTTGVVGIGTDGTVTPNVGTNVGWVSLGGISFYTDQ